MELKKHAPEKVAAIKKKCRELSNQLKNDGSVEDREIDQMINTLRASVDLYYCSFEGDECVSCSG